MTKSVSYEEYISKRDILKRPVQNSIQMGGFTMFKSLEDAEAVAGKNANLFIISLTVEQWSETDLYPQLHDGIVPKAFGYFVAYGESKNETTVFNDFSY